MSEHEMMPSPNLTPGEFSKPEPESTVSPHNQNLRDSSSEEPDVKKIRLSTPETTQTLLEANNGSNETMKFSAFNGPALTQAPSASQAQAPSGIQLHVPPTLPQVLPNTQYLPNTQFAPSYAQYSSHPLQSAPSNPLLVPANIQLEPSSTQFVPSGTPAVPSGASAVPQGQASEPPMTYAMKKQLERMEKQRQRELERLEREAKKEYERLAKKEERERKELERKAKREQLEKEKEQKREEERVKREEKRKKAEDERKRKEEERRKKELERKQKEDERRRKEEQKERSQMRISSFFAVKPEKPKKDTRSSLPAAADTTKRTTEQYDKDFLPFFKKRNVLMASSGQLLEKELLRSVLEFDSALKLGTKLELSLLSHTRHSVEITVHTNSDQLVQALNSPLTTEKEIQQLVANLPPIKYLQFYENSKPPFIGTWCSLKHTGTAITPQNVLDTSLTGFDYNYDSDLDWDGDDEDGEDIDELEDGEEEDDDMAEEEDMDDFVEDTGEGSKKRVQVGKIQSTTYWNDGSSTLPIFDDIKYERLDPHIDFPIDPFKDYWETAKTAPTPPPQKAPLVSLDQLGTPQKTNTQASPNILTPQKPTIKEPEIIKKLMEFVEKNCDFSIGTLSELAKKEFKTYTKSILKHTIQEVAVYNKKKGVWEVKPEVKA